jgi:calpain-7
MNGCFRINYKYFKVEPEPFKEGVRINSPHYLVKLVDECNSTPAQLTYTFVVSQYEKSTSIYFTLRAYSTQHFQMNEIKEPYNPRYFKCVAGKWQGRTAGGCPNNQESYKNNPLYQICLAHAETSLKIELKGPQ